MLLLAPDEPRAPIAILLPAKRAALTACLNSGILHKRCGVWTAPSASACDKPISDVTVAYLGRDGMLTLSMLHGSASARFAEMGSSSNALTSTLAPPMGLRARMRAEGRGRIFVRIHDKETSKTVHTLATTAPAFASGSFSCISADREPGAVYLAAVFAAVCE